VGDRYHVEKLYRAGGLGRVWLARDETIGRTVALKDLRPERSGDRNLRGRFVEEARITGQLEHPSIVPLYDFIDGPGGPCYTMRFVAGRTLTEAARAYHDARLAGKTDRLALTALLDAFVAVCRAVAYAHNRGVLHRDLKGQNVVVGDYGEVFVLDWGLAKLSADPMTVDEPAIVTPDPGDSREATGSGAVLGTPAFIAPELVHGPATRSSDVYGLGAMLYVILTGRSPYDGPTMADVYDQLLAGPPPPPRGVNPSCPPALDAICRKAMAREPAGRYASAEAVAADVRRWLADEPVGAYAEGFATRAARWARHHRGLVFGSFAVLVTAVVGLLVSNIAVRQEERKTADQRDRAEQNLGLASDLAYNLLKSSDKGWQPANQDAVAARKKLTESALDTFARSLEQRPDDPKLRQRVASAHHYSANFLRQTSQLPAAGKAYQESVKLLDDLATGQPDDASIQEELSETLRDQAQLFSRLGRLGDAIAAGRRSASLAERLVAIDPGQPGFRRTLATGLIDQSGYEYERGQNDASEASAGRAAELLVELVQSAGKSPPAGDVVYLAMALHRRAVALGEQKDRLVLSLTTSAEALKRLEPLPRTNLESLHFQGRILVEQAKVLLKDKSADRSAEAERDVSRAIKLWDDLQQRLSFAPYRSWQAAAYELRGRIRAKLGSTEPATPEVEKSRSLALEDLEKSRLMLEKLAAGSQDQPGYRALLGQTYLTLGRLAKAGGDGAGAAAWFTKSRGAFKAALARSPENAVDRHGLREAEDELQR
jgi:serine/threonine-protein kinase